MARSMRRVLAGEDDPDPTWPDEGAGPDDGERPTSGADGACGRALGGLVDAGGAGTGPRRRPDAVA